MNQAVAAQDDIGGRQPVLCDVGDQEATIFATISPPIAFDEIRNHVDADVFYAGQINRAHPVEIATSCVD
jgi:hypothetical protein